MPTGCRPAARTAEHAELADAVASLTDAYGYRLADTDPLAPLARDIARNLVEAGFTLHHCARTHPATGSAASACCPYPSMFSGRPQPVARCCTRWDHPSTVLRLVPAPPPNGTAVDMDMSGEPAPEGQHSHLPVQFTRPDRTSGPDHSTLNHADRATSQAVDARATPTGPGDAEGNGEDDLNAATVIAYRASIQAGAPLSERKLAQMFGKTSRRWARNRMAEATQEPPLHSPTPISLR